MQFFRSVRSPNESRNFKTHMMVTGIFIGFSYALLLLPLSLFAIAQTMAIFGKKRTFLLCFLVVIVLCALAFTGLSSLVLAALFAIVTIPLFLIVSVLRQKRTSLLWSAAVLFVPIALFFGMIVSAPVLDSAKYESEIQKIENTLSLAQSQTQGNPKNIAVYEKAVEQLELVRKDASLRTFMAYTLNQRIIYFVYGSGFAILFSILLSFFASLFFLDFAFEQVEKLYSIKKYVNSLSAAVFDKSFTTLLDTLTVQDHTKNDRELNSSKEFKIVKHSKIDLAVNLQKDLFLVWFDFHVRQILFPFVNIIFII